jgi:hypothetical protein
VKFKKKDMTKNSLIFEKNSAGIIKTPYNMKRCLRFFYFYILNIAKFWLNILMDDAI